MGYKASKKQALAHQAFMSGGYKRGVLLWGRQCLDGDTLVRTEAGLKPIRDISIGDKVMSFGDDWEYKGVTGVTEYGVDIDPKPMVHFVLYGQEINCTYDHPFYHSGHYVPIYQLIWGVMDARQREKLRILCEQYGSPFDNPQAQQKRVDSSDETSSRPKGLSTDDGGRTHNKDTPVSSTDMATESSEPSRSEPQRLRRHQQRDNQSGVDDSSGQHSSHPQSREGGKLSGGELNIIQAQRISGAGDTSFERHTPSTDSRAIRGFHLHNSGHSLQEELATHIVVSEAQTTYSIEVEDNQNYCITEVDILVANSGKTFFSTQHSWISAIKDQGRYFIVFKTYKQAHEVVWRQYIPLIPKELIYKKNEQDLLIEFNYLENTEMILPSGEKIILNHDTSLPRSTLQLLGSDQADSHRGFRANGMIFDEYGDQDPENWDTVYKHFFTTTDGWAIFMGTPRGYNHFYDLVQFSQEDERWFFQKATWRDSPYVKKEFIEAERKEAEKQGKLSAFLQEVELEFRSVQGAVYPSFSRDIHVLKPLDIPQDLTYYGAIDFGWHTTAFLLFGVDKDQTWYLVDEVYGKEETLDNVIPRIKQVIGDKRLVLMVGDSANRDAIEVMQRDFPIVGINKANDARGYATGIGLITEKLKPRVQLVGNPKPTLYVGSNCKQFMYELEAYRFPEEKAERNPSDIPIKENDHGPDAARYLFLHLKFGVANDNDKLPDFDIVKQTNQYGIL